MTDAYRVEARSLTYVSKVFWQSRMEFIVWDGRTKTGLVTIFQVLGDPDIVRVHWRLIDGLECADDFDRLPLSRWLRTPESDPLISGKTTWEHKGSDLKLVVAGKQYDFPTNDELARRGLDLVATW